MTTTAAQHRERRKGKAQAANARKRGWVEVTFPEELKADARFLKVQWDPEAKVWIGKKGAQAQLDAILDAAPDGQTALVETTDCPYCERTACFRTYSYRTIGSADWSVGATRRCDFCFATTAHPLFEPLEQLAGESTEAWLERCRERIDEKLAASAERHRILEGVLADGGVPSEVIDAIWTGPEVDFVVLDGAGSVVQIIANATDIKPTSKESVTSWLNRILEKGNDHG